MCEYDDVCVVGNVLVGYMVCVKYSSECVKCDDFH